MANKEKLFTEFAAPTTQEWLDKIQVDLKGADFQKRLVWRTNEGFNVQPFYRREDLANLKTPDRNVWYGEPMKVLMYSPSIAVKTWRI